MTWVPSIPRVGGEGVSRPATAASGITFVSASNYVTGTAANATPTEPAGAASGNLLLGMFIVDSPGATATQPAGWTSILAETSQSGFFLTRLAWIIRGGSAPSLTFGCGSAFRECVIVCYSGVNGTPIDVALPASVKTTTGKPDPPASGASATTGAVALALQWAWGNAPPGGFTAPSGYTLRAGAVTLATLAIADKTLAGSGTNEDPGAYSGTPNTNNDGIATTVLLRPA